MKYQGYTYPEIFQKAFVRKLWAKFLCPKQMHLWDEVKTHDRHYLHCDSCGLEVELGNNDRNER